MSTANLAAPVPHAATRILALLLAAQVVLFLIPLVVLGRAIGWPASLRLSPAEALPLVAREAFAVQAGYWGYIATVVAMVPLVLALRRWALANGVAGLAVDCMVAFGLAAALFKALGIVRWLIAMPRLASRYVETTDPALRPLLEVAYEVLNGYAGGVGELLGVQLFSGLWMIALGLVLRQMRFALHGWASLAVGAGFVTCAFRTLAPPLEVLQAVLPPLALLWLLSLALSVWRSAHP